MDRFTTCLENFTWLPNHDGQPCHTTEGDPGGVTSWGATYGTYTGWLRNNNQPIPTVEEFSTFPRETFIPFYRDAFWNALMCDHLYPGLDLMVFDFGVISGPGAAVTALQECLGGCGGLGVLGPLTRAAILQRSNTVKLQSYYDQEFAYLRNLRNFDRFGDGWLNRAHAALTQGTADAAAAGIVMS